MRKPVLDKDFYPMIKALEAFEDNHIVLPLAVLEELDGLKNAEGEKAAAERGSRPAKKAPVKPAGKGRIPLGRR